ncbi:hypothetical protein P5673_033095 [Acropora cervicornis]|uniref:Uncharacterized protein n=1 Tax=Acropora cervicornis TaxID=6130 RepID=A0AAD9URI6_ACRCE|nr:hypothetical protein P5673_033095 [Acropora cervicornis]
MSRRLEAGARKAKLEVEKKFLDQEHEMRRLQLMKEISIAEAEKNVMNTILNKESETTTAVKEPAVFSGDSFKYPAFVTAFDSIIANNVHTEKDRLSFLEKYISGSANEVIKGFLAMNSDTACKEARKLLDQRYGSPVIVAENYKSNLRNWQHINNGDSKGLREFSDFLIRCYNTSLADVLDKRAPMR